MKLKGRGLFVFLAGMLIFTGISRAAASFTVAQVEVEEPQSRRIMHTVTGSGMVDQMKEQAVYAAADVLVEEITVKQGQNVHKGDVLARLDMDSILEKMDSLADEIELLRLQNMDLAAAQQKKQRDKARARTRAGEDYESVVSQSTRNIEEARQSVKEAEEKLKEAKKQAKNQAAEEYEKKLEELQAAVKAAEKAYDKAKEQEENEVLRAKRALEDAQKTPAATYDSEILQIQINQKQQELSDLYRRRREGETGLDRQIKDLEDEIRTLILRQKEMDSAASKQAEERKQTIARAQEDYNSTVKQQERRVKEATEELDTANKKLKEFLESDGQNILEDASVKAAEEALKEAKKALKEAKQQAKEEKRQAKRNLEDASAADIVSHDAEINQIQIAEKQHTLAMLESVKKNRGKITAPMEGTVTQVQLEIGQRTVETAAFFMSDTSGGMSFTTEISKEDAVYVTAGDTVMLVTADKEYEDFSVVSVETDEEEIVKVTVFVPENTLSLGEYADMVLEKESKEYGITLPLSAIHTEKEKNFVFVMVDDTVLGGQYVAQRMDVVVAEKNETYAALTNSALASDNQVIVSSDQMISAGETVRLQDVEE